MSQDFSLYHERRVTSDRPSAKLWSYKQRPDGGFWLTFQINEVQGDLVQYPADGPEFSPAWQQVQKTASEFADIQFWNDNENFHPEPVEAEQDFIDMATADYYSDLGVWPVTDEEYQHATYP